MLILKVKQGEDIIVDVDITVKCVGVRKSKTNIYIDDDKYRMSVGDKVQIADNILMLCSFVDEESKSVHLGFEAPKYIPIYRRVVRKAVDKRLKEIMK